MAAPTFVADYQTVFNTSTTPKTVSVTVAAGDTLCVVGCIEDDAGTLGTPTGGGLTYTLATSQSVSNNCGVYVWTAPCAASQTFTLSATRATGTTQMWGVVALRFSGSAGVGAAASVSTGSGGPSQALTTTVANSAIVVVSGDWNAIDGASRTWRTINSITPTAGNALERLYFRDAAAYAVYVGYWNDVGTAGSKTTGLSAPVGQKYTIAAVEIKAGTGGTAFTQNLAGALTSGAAVTKADSKPLAGAFTPAGALAKQAQKPVVGAMTSAGLLTRQPRKFPAGTLTSGATLTRAVTQARGGSLTSNGAPRKAATHPLAGTLTSAGSLANIRATLMTLVGSMTSSAVLRKTAARALAGVLSSAAAPRTAVGIAKTGAVTSSGTPRKTAAKPVVGSMASAGALSKLRAAVLALSGLLSSSATVRQAATKPLAGAVTSSGALGRLRAAVLGLAGVLTSSGLVTRITSATGSTVTVRPVTGSTIRPATGRTLRPDTGTTDNPS